MLAENKHSNPKAIHRSLTKSESIDDIRSDSEEDSEDHSPRKKQQ